LGFFGVIDIVDDAVGAFLGKTLSDGFANARARAGDDSDFSCEASWH
jgi:hypothetical protein